MEEQNLRVENELKVTQKLYYKANYRDFPPYQIETYQASYENICAEIDELHLRHRNRLVYMIKQSYQLILQQMLDCHQTQKVCAETGIRFLSVFDAEPKEALPEGYTTYSSAYNAMYHNSVGAYVGYGTAQVLNFQNPSGRENNMLEYKDAEKDTLKAKTSIDITENSNEPQMSLSALSLSPAAQRVSNQVLGYQYYTGDGNKESASESHVFDSQCQNGIAVDENSNTTIENRHSQSQLAFSHEANKILRADRTNAESAKLLQTTNRTQYGDDDDEEKIRPYNVPIQTYPTIASPFAGFRSVNGYSRFS